MSRRRGRRPSLANGVSASDRATQTVDFLVAPFSSVGVHVLLVLIAAPGEQLPARVRPAMQSLLDDGGVLIDRALAAQVHDRACSKTCFCVSDATVRPARIAGVEKALSALWPNADRALLRSRLARGRSTDATRAHARGVRPR